MNPLANYHRILHKFWWLIVLTVAVAMASALVVTAGQTPIYRAATLQLVVPNSRVQANGEILRSLDTLDRRTVLATLARVPLTRETRDAAAERLGAQPAALRPYRVSSTVLPNTNLIKLEVEGPDPEIAAELANTVAIVMQDAGREMYRIYKIDTLERAVPATRPMSPIPQRNLLAGAVLGLFIGLVVAATAEYLRSSTPTPLSSHAIEAIKAIKKSPASGS